MVAIIAFGNKDNVLLKKIVKLIDEEEKKFINLSKEETEETKSEIKDLESEVEKTKEKIKEIENTSSKKEDLDSFFDERLK